MTGKRSPRGHKAGAKAPAETASNLNNETKEDIMRTTARSANGTASTPTHVLMSADDLAILRRKLGPCHSLTRRVRDDLTEAADPNLARYRTAAERHACDGELEIDAGALVALVSKGSDAGAYVMAWLWISDDELQPPPANARQSDLRTFHVLCSVTRGERYEIRAPDEDTARDTAFSEGKLIDSDTTDVWECDVEEVTP